MRHTFVALALLSVLPAGAQALRVGTIKKDALVVAWYRSPQWASVTKAKIAERDAAKKAGDTRKVADLEKWGESNQELAHRQLAGEAPVDNILAEIAPGLADIARKAGVQAVTVDLAYADPAVERVDVTELVLDYLQANEATRKIIRGMPVNKGHVH